MYPLSLSAIYDTELLTLLTCASLRITCLVDYLIVKTHSLNPSSTRATLPGAIYPTLTR